MIDVNKLRTIGELKGKVTQLFSRQQILEMVDKKLIPHYILTNPLTKTEIILFDNTEINYWLTKHLKENRIDLEQELHFLCFDPSHFTFDATDKIPPALTQLKRLYKLSKNHYGTPHGVYFLCKDEEVVYVGQAQNIRDRVQSHRSEKVKEFDSVYFILCHIDQLDQIETALIRHLRPKYNVSQNGGNRQNDISIVEAFLGQNNT